MTRARVRVVLSSILTCALGCHGQGAITLTPRPDLPPPTSMLGWYDIGPRHQVFVTEGPTGGLRLLDFDSARFVGLRLAPDSSWLWPVAGGAARRLTTDRDGTGSVASLSWSDSTGGRGTLARATSYPFDQKVVHFLAPDSTPLTGVLLLPRVRKFIGRTGGPLREVPFRSPAAVIVHGSGASDRDNVWAYQFAAQLARSGVVVLFPDKRGSGASAGRWQTADFNTLADDALAGVAVLRHDPAVDTTRIGVVGLSQGGWIAPIAARRGGLAFVVDISGAAVTPDEQFIHEVTQDLRRAQLSDPDIGRVLALVRMGQSFARAGTPETWRAYTTTRTELLRGPLGPIVAESESDSTADWWRWWHAVGTFDPLPLWRQLSIPVLVIYGEDDERDNVPVARSVRNLQEALAPERDPHHLIRVFPGAGHALGDPTTGGVRRDVLALLASFVETDLAPAKGLAGQ